MNDPSLQAVLTEIENQRNAALTRSAFLAGEVAKLKSDYAAATKEIAALKAKLAPPKDAGAE